MTDADATEAVGAGPGSRLEQTTTAAHARRAPWGIADQVLLSGTSFMTMAILARVLTRLRMTDVGSTEAVDAGAGTGLELTTTRARARRASWGVADQALLSATSFVTLVLLARQLTPSSFGAFTLLYTTVLLTNGFQGTLVTQPHNVLGVDRGPDYRRYTSSTGLTQVAVAVLVAAVVGVAAVASDLAGWSATPLVVALIPTTVAWMTQEFLRRVLYTEGRLRDALHNDLISYGGQTVAIFALWRAGSLTATNALYAIAGTSALAVAFGVWQLRGSFVRGFSWNDVRDNWNFGKWLAGAFAAYWCSSQLYIYLSAVMLGTAATGSVKAALVVMGPLNVLLVFIDTTVPTMLVRARHSGGEPALRRELRLAVAATAPLVCGYCGAAALLPGPLLHVFYGHRYVHATLVLSLFAVHYVVLFITRAVGAGVRALRNTRAVFNGHAAAAIVAILFGWLIIKLGGVAGVVVGMLLSSSIVCLFLLRAYLSPLTGVVGAGPSPAVSKIGGR